MFRFLFFHVPTLYIPIFPSLALILIPVLLSVRLPFLGFTFPFLFSEAAGPFVVFLVVVLILVLDIVVV